MFLRVVALSQADRLFVASVLLIFSLGELALS